MNIHPHYTCDASGVTIRHAAPPTDRPRNFNDHPVRFAVHRDCTLELYGEHFSAKKTLTVDEALGLAMLLLFAVRDDAAIIELSREVSK
ncbi:hypothetical protein [Hydrogenophaga sp.]|uniref:hypothetical protein n=1 Tax=Hydrogenophaga sp. TaxID=1904254 RepID=UPI0035B42404